MNPQITLCHKSHLSSQTMVMVTMMIRMITDKMMQYVDFEENRKDDYDQCVNLSKEHRKADEKDRTIRLCLHRQPKSDLLPNYWQNS